MNRPRQARVPKTESHHWERFLQNSAEICALSIAVSPEGAVELTGIEQVTS